MATGNRQQATGDRELTTGNRELISVFRNLNRKGGYAAFNNSYFFNLTSSLFI